MEGTVQIPLEKFYELVTKSVQRDAMLRFAAKSRYSIDKESLFNLCGEEVPQSKEDD